MDHVDGVAVLVARVGGRQQGGSRGGRRCWGHRCEGRCRPWGGPARGRRTRATSSSGRGPDEAVDREQVARRVGAPQLAEHGTGPQRSVGDHVDGPGQHDLAGVAGLDPSGGLGHRLAPRRAGVVRSAGRSVAGPSSAGVRPASRAKPTAPARPRADHGVDVVGGRLGVGRRDRRDPAGAVVGPTHHHRGHQQLGRRRRVERQRPEGDRTACRVGPRGRRPRWQRGRRPRRRHRPGRPAGQRRCGRRSPTPARPARSCTNTMPSSPATARRSGSESRGRVRATSAAVGGRGWAVDRVRSPARLPPGGGDQLGDPGGEQARARPARTRRRRGRRASASGAGR